MAKKKVKDVIETAVEKVITGYKVFTPDWTCRGFQFAVGETYKHEGRVKACSSGFHACLKLADCFSYYSFDPKNKVALVELSGQTETHEDDSKIAAEIIKIVRELTWAEVLDLANSGNGNSGHSNSGNRNSGNRNSGNRNSGNRNSGDYNSGDYNSGDYNSGDYNSGDCNSGNRNSGNRNSGNRNSGNRNSGNRNSGNRNSGYCNKTSRSAGSFNTEEAMPIFFNKPADRLFDDIDHPDFSGYQLTEFVWSASMTDEEKARFPKHEIHGGYLKTISYKEMWAKGWATDSDSNKRKFFNLPNFDLQIFLEITGLDVKGDYERLMKAA